MLRCPKCSRLYQDGAQRFCTNDGGRLLLVDDALQPVERTPTGSLARRTPAGELLFETNVLPPTNYTAAPEPARAAGFEKFGLHSTADTGAKKNGERDFVPFDSTAAEAAKEAEILDLSRADANLSDAGAHLERGKSRFDFPFLAVCVFGGLLCITGAAFLGTYLLRQPPPTVNNTLLTTPAASEKPETIESPAVSTAPVETPAVIQPPPETTAVKAALPANFNEFRNTRENSSGKLAEKFVGFSLGYPNSWKKNENKEKAQNFLDVSNRLSTGLPLEQMIVSWYDSRGTFEGDQAVFPALAKKLNAAYSKEIPAFRQVSQGATKINGADAYEVRFEGATVDPKSGEKVKIWGRTIFLPAGNAAAKSGLNVTVLATSLSPAFTVASDVGAKGESAKILETLRLEN